MKKANLKVENRTVVGRKVKKLRREGILPATIYGKDIKSLSVQVGVKDFDTVYKEVGETGLVELSLGTDKTRPVLIKNVQLDPKYSTPLHIDFYQVNLSEKIKANIPIEAVGEPKAVLDKVGLLLTPLSEIEVESLPTDLPEKIEVDVARLAAIDDQITIGDVKAPSGVTILTDPGQILFKVGALISKEAEEQAKAEEAAAAAKAAEAGKEAGAEGAAPAEGEVPVVEGEKPAEAPKEEAKPEE